MKVCQKCGEENLFSKAMRCRKCGAELFPEAEPEPIINDNVTGDSAYSDPIESPSNSELRSEDSDFEETDVGQQDGGSFDDNTQKSRMADPFNPNSDSVEVDEVGSCSGTVEIDLPDDSDETDQPSASDSEITPAPQETQPLSKSDDALAAEEKSRLIADLQSKIPTMVKNGQNGNGKTNIEGNADTEAEDSETDAPSLQDFSNDLSANSDQEAPVSAPNVAPTSGNSSEEITTDELLERNRPAYFDKNRLVFPADIAFKADDRVSFDHEVFILKKKARDNKSYMLYGILGLVVLLVLVAQFLRNRSEYYPPLAGVVVDASDGRVLPDVRVTIDELNKSVISNSSGVFIFELVPNGSYTIRADAPNYSEASVSFFQGDGSSPVVALAAEDTSPRKDNYSANRKNASDSKESKSASEQKYGTIKVETDVAKAEIYLDNMEYGTGSRKINRVLEGNHKLVVAMDGYERFEQMVTVHHDQTTTVTAELQKIEKKKKAPSAAEYVQSADSALTAGDFQLAIEYYSKALAKGEKAETYYKRAQVYHKAGKPSDARNDFMRAGNIFASEGQATSAIASFNAVLDLFPNDMKALRARGYANINRGQYELALADFETACNLDENSYENQIGRGNAYAVLGRHKDAINAYKDAEKLTDSKAEAYALIAMTSLVRGKEKDAKKYYEKFLEAATPQDEQRYAKDPDWQRLKQIAANN